MNRLVLAVVSLLWVVMPVWAADDEKQAVVKPTGKSTFEAVRALANQVNPEASPYDRPAPGSAKRPAPSAPNRRPKAEPKRDDHDAVHKQVKATKKDAVRDKQPRAGKQQVDRGQQQLGDRTVAFRCGHGAQPWGRDRFARQCQQGFCSHYGRGHWSYGYPGYSSPYFWPGYYGYGFFSPVAFGISGPTVIKYDDPLGRQWKLVDDGVRRFAENPGGLPR